MGKNVARTQWSASALSTAGVLAGHGPSSKVKSTSPLRRKSCILKCSQPKPGPPVVSISTTRATPSALGLPGQAAVGAAAGGGAAARAGGAAAGVAGGRPVCAQAKVAKDVDNSAHAYVREPRINVSP